MDYDDKAEDIVHQDILLVYYIITKIEAYFGYENSKIDSSNISSELTKAHINVPHLTSHQR